MRPHRFQKSSGSELIHQTVFTVHLYKVINESVLSQVCQLGFARVRKKQRQQICVNGVKMSRLTHHVSDITDKPHLSFFPIYPLALSYLPAAYSRSHYILALHI